MPVYSVKVKWQKETWKGELKFIEFQNENNKMKISLL